MFVLLLTLACNPDDPDKVVPLDHTDDSGTPGPDDSIPDSGIDDSATEGDDSATDDSGTDDSGTDDSATPPCTEEGATQCASASLLETCVAGTWVPMDCAASAELCGPDPKAPEEASTCLAMGDPCGTLDFFGACEGDVIAYCGGDTLVVRDCATSWASCGWESDAIGYNCLTDCDTADPPATADGACVGNAIRRCSFADGAWSIETDACPEETTCATSPETGWASCLPDGCPLVGPEGACAGTELTTCEGGRTVMTDCTASGDTCAFDGQAYTCAPVGDSGGYSVSGIVEYEDRPVDASGLGAYEPLPVRGAAVAIVAEDGTALAAGTTGDDGTYTLAYDVESSAKVHVVVATTSAEQQRPVRVLKPDATIHAAVSPSFAAVEVHTEDLLITDLSGVAPAFNVFDQLVSVVDAIRDPFGLTAPVPVLAQWVRGSEDGTFYWSGHGVYLRSSVWDEDAYDDAVVVHELGHYVQAEYGLSNSSGGFHGPGVLEPTLAWDEGLATWFSSYVRGEPLYVDTRDYAVPLALDLEGTITTADPKGSMSQDLAADLVSELLWDLGDAYVGDDDGFTDLDRQDVVLLATHQGLLALETDRGFSGMDLVDGLDAWIAWEGAGECENLADLTETYGFPYDFATCP
jgi:hypothetical protein